MTESNMSAEAGPSQLPAQQSGKKRKRTGKERQERKQAAILAAQTASAAGVDEAPQTEVTDVEPANDAVVDTAAVDFETLSKRLPRALTHLRHVFKRAKTVEMTRLIKKIKLLRSKGGTDVEKELADLEAQRQILSHINLASTLSSHLLTNLRKHRLIKRTPDALPASIVEQLTMTNAASSSTQAEVIKKVENRLFSSKAAAQETKAAVAWLFNEEGAKLGGTSTSAQAVKSSTNGAKDGRAAQPKTSKEAEAEDGADADEDEDDEQAEDVSSARRKIVPEDNSEDEADAAGWESGSVSGGDEEPAPSSRRRELAIANSDESEDEDSVAISPKALHNAKKLKPTPTPGAKAAAPPRASKQLTSSTFLPSLSTGFTRGDSDDSDPDDDFGEGLEDVIGKSAGRVKKNRRGQQARRAIWERKYGKNAKHIQKAKAQELEGNIANAYGKRAGAKSVGDPAPKSDPAAAATAPTSTGHASSRPAPRPASGPAPAAATGPTTAPSAPAKQGGLHPSWEAARLRKQKEATGPKATKIVFD